MKKFHYFDIDQIRQRNHSESKIAFLDFNLFLKYFPKHQKDFKLWHHNGPVRSKVKRMKAIQDLQTYTKFQKRSDWRVLLSNKMKSIEILSSHLQSGEQFARKIKLCPNLRSLQVRMSDLFSGFNKPAEGRESIGYLLYKNMKDLKKLEHLDITPLSKDSYPYISELNSSPKFLDSLKTLQIVFNWRGFLETELPEVLESNRNLLKNVTSLSLSSLYLPFHFENFQRLGELCPRISKIDFEISCRPVLLRIYPSRFGTESIEVNTNYLQTLSSFADLRYLSINIADTFTFLRDLALPKSVQNLRFCFEECLTKKIMRKIQENFNDSSEEDLAKVFEENNLFIKFYENFIDLERLEKLELRFGYDSNADAYKYQSFLAKSLLKRISSPVRNLKYHITAFSGGLYKKESIPDQQEDKYLSEIFESCGGFASTLETIVLGSSKVLFSRFELSAFQGKFPRLSLVEVRGRFTGEIYTAGEFLKQVVSLGDSIRLIKFGAHINRKVRPMLDFLKSLNQISRSEKLEMRLDLGFLYEPDVEGETELNYIDGINELNSNQECYSEVKGGVSLKLHGGKKSGVIADFMNLYSKRFEIVE